MDSSNILILKTAIENFLRSKNWQHAPRKSDALLQFLVDNENVIRFADDGKITFKDNDLQVALGKMLTLPDAREFLGVEAI